MAMHQEAILRSCHVAKINLGQNQVYTLNKHRKEALTLMMMSCIHVTMHESQNKSAVLAMINMPVGVVVGTDVQFLCELCNSTKYFGQTKVICGCKVAESKDLNVFN